MFYISLYINFTRKKNTHEKFAWELEAFTGYLLHHLESNFVLHAAAPLRILGCFIAGLSDSPVECSRSIRIYVSSEPVLLRQFHYVNWNFPIRRILC